MAEQIYRQPQRRRRDDEPAQSGDISRPSGQTFEREESTYDEGTTHEALSNIDEILAANEAGAATHQAPAEKSSSPQQLKNAESAPASTPSDSLNYTGKGARKGGTLGRVRNFAKKHRKGLLLAGGAGAGLAPIVTFLLFFAASLGLPNFAQNMAAWQFAKVTRTNATSSRIVADEQVAMSAVDDGAWARLKARYGSLRNNTWGRLDNWRPNKIIKNLNAQDLLQYSYVDRKGIAGAVGLQRLAGIQVGDRSVVVPQTGLKDKYLHPVQTLQNRLDYYNALDEALQVHNPKIPTLVRSSVVKKISAEVGASWTGIVAAKLFNNKTPAQADALLQSEAYKAIDDDSGIQGSSSDEIKKVANEAKQAEKTCMEDPNCAAQTVKGDLPANVANTIDNSFKQNALKSVVDGTIKGINPVYAAAVPLCTIYDGSKYSPASVKATSHEKMRSSALVLSTSDQQERGNDSDVNPDNQINDGVLQSFNDKLNGETDMNQSNVLRRAAGKTVDTTQTINAQQTPLGTFGDYTVFNLAFDGISKNMAQQFNQSADKSCPVLSNVWFGLGLGIVNIGVAIAGIFTGGASDAAQAAGEEAVQQGANQAIHAIVDKVVAQFTTKEGLRTAWQFSKQFGKDTTKYGAITEGATLLTKLIVISRMGSGPSISVGDQFRNDTDEGTNLLGNTIEQQAYYGRPLTPSETVASHTNDVNEVALQNSSRSTFDRYLATTNANSLTSHLAMNIRANMTNDLFANFLNYLGRIFNPTSFFSHLFGSLNTTASFAAGNASSTDYNDLQWGWSDAEWALIKSNATYGPNENSYILEKSGKQDEIEQKYGKCNTTEAADLIGDHSIVRDGQSGVINVNDGLCSPKSLGCNQDAQGKCIAKNTDEEGKSDYDYQDLIFRWRWYHCYTTTTDIGLQIQGAQS